MLILKITLIWFSIFGPILFPFLFSFLWSTILYLTLTITHYNRPKFYQPFKYLNLFLSHSVLHATKILHHSTNQSSQPSSCLLNHSACFLQPIEQPLIHPCGCRLLIYHKHQVGVRRRWSVPIGWEENQSAPSSWHTNWRHNFLIVWNSSIGRSNNSALGLTSLICNRWGCSDLSPRARYSGIARSGGGR